MGESRLSSRATLIDSWHFKPWLLVGIGYYFAWMLYVVFDLQGLVFADGGCDSLVLVRMMLSGTIAACMILAMVASERFDFLNTGKWALALAGGISALGTVFLVFSLNYVDSFALIFCSTVLLGMGNSVLYLSWGRHLVGVGAGRLAGHVAISCLFAGAVYAVLQFIPSELAFGIVVACPIASAVTLVICAGIPSSVEASAQPLDWRTGFTRILLSCLVAAFFLGIIRALPVYGAILSHDRVMVGGTVVAIFAVVLTVLLLVGWKSPVVSLYRACSILLIVGYATIFFSVEAAPLLSLGFIMGGSVLFEGLMLLLFPFITVHTKTRTICLFGWTAVALHVGSLLGLVAGDILASLATEYEVLFSAAALLTLAILFFFIFKEMDVIGFTGHAFGGAVAVPCNRDLLVNEIALRFRLSPRETEVFALLANGRSLPYIEEKLVVSHSTAKTHVRHIYEKTGVSGRQELHDLIEGELAAH